MEEIRLEQVKNNDARWEYIHNNWEQIYFNDEFKLEIDKLKGTPFVRIVLWGWNPTVNDWFRNELGFRRITPSGRLQSYVESYNDIIEYLKGLAMHLRGKGL